MLPCLSCISTVLIESLQSLDISVSRKIRNLDQIRVGGGSRRTFPGQLARLAATFPFDATGDPRTVPQISFSFNLGKDIYSICRPPMSFTYRVYTKFSQFFLYINCSIDIEQFIYKVSFRGQFSLDVFN